MNFAFCNLTLVWCVQVARILLFVYMFYHVYLHYDQVAAFDLYFQLLYNVPEHNVHSFSIPISILRPNSSFQICCIPLAFNLLEANILVIHFFCEPTFSIFPWRFQPSSRPDLHSSHLKDEVDFFGGPYVMKGLIGVI